MQTVIQSSDYALTESLNRFIRQQVSKTMRSSASQVQRLELRLKDINGPKGGNDKECCVEVTLANSAPVIVSKRSSDAYLSIRKALSQASRSTLRKLRKRRSFKSAALAKNHSLISAENDGFPHHEADNENLNSITDKL